MLKLLVVEDHALVREGLVRLLAQVEDGCQVSEAADFETALQEPWDAILSDHDLPGFTGLEALALLRASGRMLPFVIVSGQIGEAMAVEAMRSGASDYILKQNLARLAPALEHAIEANESRRARIAADREVARSRERLSELARHLQTSIEMERAAIAREIHDDVGGSLTALKFDLAWIERHVSDPQVLQRVQSSLDVVTHALEASQRIMHNLRPAILDQGLLAALQWMTQRFEKRTGVRAIFRGPPALPALPAGVPLVAYRTAQEALTNVGKHAQASQVTVDLSLAHGVLSLEVSDDGRGIAAGDLGKVRSFGIRGLHERAGTVGGWIDLSSGPKGTSLILSIPLEPAADDGGEAADQRPGRMTEATLAAAGLDAAGQAVGAADRADPSRWDRDMK